MMTPQDGKGWTVETLKAHFEQRFKDQQTAVDAALNAAKEAVLKAESASDKRFEGVNEFRATLADQQRTLMPRSEQETINRTLHDKLVQHERLYERLTATKTGGREMWAYIVAGVSVLIAVASFVLRAFGR